MQSSEGTTRVDVLDTDCTSRLFERVYETLHLNTFGFALYKDRSRKEEIVSSKSRQLQDYGLQHGDMIFLTSVNGTVLFDQPSTSSAVVSHLVTLSTIKQLFWIGLTLNYLFIRGVCFNFFR